MKKYGIITLATGGGNQYLDHLLCSIKETNPETAVTTITDMPRDCDNLVWTRGWTGFSSRRAKTSLNLRTPYNTTMFVDSDVIFRGPVDINSVLGDEHLIAAVPDVLPTLREAKILSRWNNGHVSVSEFDETAVLCGIDHTFYNSGMLIWKKCDETDNLFEIWHREWNKYKACDQFALARALKISGINIRTLPDDYNYQLHNKRSYKFAPITHLTGKSGVANKFNLWNPPDAGPITSALKAATSKGLMAPNQYIFLSREIIRDKGSKVLVFGAGRDTPLWREITEGTAHIVEDNPDWIAEGVDLINIPGKKGKEIPEEEVPELINQKYDYVVVDGPAGFNDRKPGRQMSIYWASKIAGKAVFVHDYDRKWERHCCDKYLGKPLLELKPNAKGYGCMAVFNVGSWEPFRDVIE